MSNSKSNYVENLIKDRTVYFNHYKKENADEMLILSYQTVLNALNIIKNKINDTKLIEQFQNNFFDLREKSLDKNEFLKALRSTMREQDRLLSNELKEFKLIQKKMKLNADIAQLFYQTSIDIESIQDY